MGETTIQPPNQGTDQRTSQGTDQQINHATSQPREKKKKKKRHVATWIALASAATAIGAAVISGLQVNLASQQNTAAEQQQLVNLATLIGQQFQQLDSTPATTPKGLTGTQVAAGTVQGRVVALTIEGQAGAVLIRDLGGVGVAGVEYVEVARALYYGGDTADAITFYNDALTAPPNDAVTHALALRYLGGLNYQLGRNAIAHQDFMRAAKVFSGHPLATRYYVADNIAQAYFTDAGFQMTIKDCRIAAADMAAARRALGSYQPGPVALSVQTLDKKYYSAYCPGAETQATP